MQKEMDYLPDSWRFKDAKNSALEAAPELKMSRADQQWIGETLFVYREEQDQGWRWIYTVVASTIFQIQSKPEATTWHLCYSQAISVDACQKLEGGVQVSSL